MNIKTTMDIWKNPHLFDNKRWIDVEDMMRLLIQLKKQNTNGGEYDRQRALAFGTVIKVLKDDINKM